MIVIPTQKSDEDGDYTLLTKVYFKAIDASFLRVCKQIYNECIEVLYGKNNFAFGTADEHYHHGRLWYGEQGRGSSLLIRKPAANNDKALTRAKFHIIHKDQCADLPGWLCYDPFSRFLWTITISNAATLGSLTFTGRVKTHHCKPLSCGTQVCEDLVQSLQLYIPFLNKFCTNLKHLTIQVMEEYTLTHSVHINRATRPSGTKLCSLCWKAAFAESSRLRSSMSLMSISNHLLLQIRLSDGSGIARLNEHDW